MRLLQRLRYADKYGRDPSQAIRLLWFFVMFLTPWGAVGYAWLFDLKHGNAQDVIRVLWILSASLVVSVACAIGAPLQSFDEAQWIRIARTHLCFAIVNTVCLAILFQHHPAVLQACQTASGCGDYPVALLAITGMFYCYAVFCYTIDLIYSG
ncbi:hypothetical protein JQ633_04750 [Bradyrhizobium tropiciagri]|uniref:hypothetical protein n=1 Tax=Bradyrhizobium tropiciagri TaxID=312253 RepID=UPI001BA55EEF|nr:hypothetical protein [Bradyrhizobium tropiciagri]MBR0869657.1 hypothetical protein [Bradyrhizobium tropiciagri]